MTTSTTPALDVEAVLAAYLRCALWASTTGEEGTPLDSLADVEDLHPDAYSSSREDVRDFLGAHEEDLTASGLDASQIGHDLFLTRNHHGAGFWDRGLPTDLGDRLTAAAHSWGSASLDLGDDGRVKLL